MNHGLYFSGRGAGLDGWQTSKRRGSLSQRVSFVVTSHDF
jgi:hypothetical protein